MAQRSLSDGEYRALAAFRRELRKFLAFSEAEARSGGLEPRQHQLLLAVRGLLPGTSATIGALSAELLLRHHSTVELVDRLERRGFVQRTRSAEDRRKVSVQTTRKGERVLAKLARAHRNELRRVGPSLVAALGAILGPGGRG